MSAIGPDLPPHLLAKRKRQSEDTRDDATTTSSGAKSQESQNGMDKRRRTVGPAMPPANPEEMPAQSVVEESSDSDEDDLGPALPSNHTVEDNHSDATSRGPDPGNACAQSALDHERLRRDEWMTMAPTQDGLAARMDPTRIRARGFNTGKSARGGGDASQTSSASAWNETAEQKQKRLADEVLGITSRSAQHPSQAQLVPASASLKAQKDEQTAERLRQKMEKSRETSLLDKHRQDKPDKADDDPSKRAFDREKDMGSGSRITGTQKRELINKASGYSSRFSGGSYL